MNTYIEKEKRETEIKITALIREFEKISQTEVDGINFVRQSMCDTSGQRIKTWDVKLSCKVM